MSEYRIPPTPEAREAVRQIRIDESQRIAVYLREIAEDPLPPHRMLDAFIERHPRLLAGRPRAIIADVLMAVAEEIENPDTEQPGEA